MPLMPFHILGLWFRALLSVAILAGGIYALRTWYAESRVAEADPIAMPAEEKARDTPDHRLPVAITRVGAPRWSFRPVVGWNRPTAWLAAGVGLLTLATLGRFVDSGIGRLTSLATGKGAKPGSKAGSHAGAAEDPREERGGETHRIRRPDGTELHVECYGSTDAPPIVWTHGWGSMATEWYYQKEHLAGRYRLIVWDEPGLGLSKKPDNDDYRLEKFAADLEAVLAFAGDRPAVLVGHSIGGMAVLTFCRVFHETLRRRVAGLILVHTTYTNPVRTTSMAGLYTALEKPVLIPMMRMTILLWPIAWALNWMSYLNGSLNRSTRSSSFAGTQTEGQVDFVARILPKCRPDILARGMLGMIAYDASDILRTINVPTLVIVGDKDTTTLPEAGQHMARTIPGATLATLAPARHMGLIEHHGQFNQMVADFVDARQVPGARD